MSPLINAIPVTAETQPSSTYLTYLFYAIEHKQLHSDRLAGNSVFRKKKHVTLIPCPNTLRLGEEKLYIKFPIVKFEIYYTSDFLYCQYFRINIFSYSQKPLQVLILNRDLRIIYRSFQNY